MSQPILHIFSDVVSSRLTYVLDLIFNQRNIAYQVINDPVVFEQSDNLKLVYSDRPFERHYLTISPGSLLFEEEIRKQTITKDEFWNTDILVINNHPDILASIFYVVSLYEEYVDPREDKHGRALLKNNILFKHGMYGKLMIERWSCVFIEYIEKQLSVDLASQKIPVSVCPTFDIDHAYAYLKRGKLRNHLSVIKDVAFRDSVRLSERKKVQLGEMKDPYDTYAKIVAINNDYFNVKVFWHLGDYGKYDRNISPANVYHKRLIRNLSHELFIGLHPSYKSNSDLSQLSIEKARISEILGHPVKHSRQHFLKLEVPKTYQHLINEGFEHDYTLGFAEQPGFRAGIARPFKWFNLEKDRVEELTIHPFAYMDGTLLEYMKCSVDEAKQVIDDLISEISKYGGDFVFIWHNETIGDYGKWKGWSSVLDFTLNTAKVKLT